MNAFAMVERCTAHQQGDAPSIPCVPVPDESVPRSGPSCAPTDLGIDGAIPLRSREDEQQDWQEMVA